MLLLILASIWVLINIYWQLQYKLPIELEGRELTLIGQVIDLPINTHKNGLRFTFNVTSAYSKTKLTTFTGKIRLLWYKDAPSIRAGEWWQLIAKLKIPHSFKNPGNFDYETHLFRNNIVAIGYIRATRTNLRLAFADVSILSLREFLRQYLINELPRNVGTGIVMALTLGDASNIKSRQWSIFNRTGINHLINISGLHLTLIGGLAFFIMKFLWQQSAYLCLRIPASQAAASGGLLIAGCYSLLAGLPVPTLRSLIVFVFIQGAFILRRITYLIDSVVIAFILVIFLDPLSVLSSSFWLSFGSVIALIYGMSNRLQMNSVFWIWVRAQWIVFVFLFPLAAFLFNQVSLISIIVNVIAIPIFTALLPLLLIAIALAFIINWFWLAQYLAWLINQGFIYLEYFATFNWINWTFSQMPWWIWLLAFPAVMLLTAPRGLPGRWIGIILILPLILWKPSSPTWGALRLIVLDVGQGQSLLIQTLNHVLLYDTGSKFPSGSNFGENTVVPALHAYGIDYIDTLIVSHADNDHAGGLSGILNHMQVGKILSGEPKKIAVPNSYQCEIGQNWSWDGVQFSILYPRQPWSAVANNRSCVLQIRGIGGSVLITGDLEQRAEKFLVSMFKNQLHSDILIAGHHGSQTSTSQTLLNQVQPKLVLISAGYRNQFGFPKLQVIERIMNIGAKIADTASGGSIDTWLEADGTMRGPFLYRKDHAYPWTHQLPGFYRDPK